MVCLDNAETPWEADTLRAEQLFEQVASVSTLLLSARCEEALALYERIPEPLLDRPDARGAAGAVLLSAELVRRREP